MIDKEVMRNFGRIWPEHVTTLVQFLVKCRRTFDGDIELFLVLCIVGDRTFSTRRVPADSHFEDWSATGALEIPSEEVNLQSVSDYSGIPRETVRRKLNILVKKGWVKRDARGFFTTTEKAKEELAPLKMSSVVYLKRMNAMLTKK